MFSNCYVSWAKELGIDLDALQTESPLHPDQLRNHRRITKAGEAYWSHERFLTQVKYGSGAISTPVPNVPVKRTKVRRYDFTEAQLEIARRSLDAAGSV